MNSTHNIRQEATWEKIEAEERRDRFIRRVGYVAWSITFLVLLFYATLVMMEFVHTLELQNAGVVSSQEMFIVLMPLAKVIGSVALLIAVLATVGVFLRLRTASLTEIQIRLAALEEALISQAD